MRTARMNHTALQIISMYFTSRFSLILKWNYKGGRLPAQLPKPSEKGQLGGQQPLKQDT